MQVSDRDKIVELIIAFLDGRAGQDDILSLRAWITQSEQRRAYFTQIKNIYEMSGRQLDPAMIHTGKALQKVLSRVAPRTEAFRLGAWLQRAAAILFIPLLAASLYFHVQPKNRSGIPVNYCEIQASAGLRSFITLPDSSRVWLNSGSKIRYPDRFVERERTVYVEGEAYFEVASSAEHPFVVNTPAIQVQATGTRFHVSDFAGDAVKEVSLVSGKLTVKGHNSTSDVHNMHPGQHLEYDLTDHAARWSEGELYKYYAWKDNKMVFRNDPMTDVVKRISQLYGVEIELRGEELKTYRYRATFEEESLYDILKLLKLSAPIDFKEVKRKQNADGSFNYPKIVIYPVTQPVENTKQKM